jgi:proteasome lid subunit RPN8/RPN11
MTISRIARIQLSVAQRRQLYGIRRRALPNEGTALLIGKYQDQGTTASTVRVIEMENVADSLSTFAIDPEHHYCILTGAAKEGLEQVGIYHSHPAPPTPSMWDLEYMEYNPCVWVIDGLLGTRYRMKAYQLLQGQLFPVAIQTILA